MHVQPRKQKWSKASLRFQTNIMYVNAYTQLIYTYEHIHKATIRVAMVAFVLQSNFLK